MAFFGDGATSHGAFHESLNFAGIQNAPVVFVCENNLYATATPLRMATRNTNIASKAASYGFPGVRVDGNDVVAVWQAAGEAVRRGPRRRGADADRSADLSPGGPSGRRPGHRLGSHAGGMGRVVQARSDPELPPLPAGIGQCHGSRTEGDRGRGGRSDSARRSISPGSRPSPIRPRPRPHIWAEPINPPLHYVEPERQAGRDGGSELDGRRPRRHRRGNAPRSAHHLFRRRDRRSRRLLRTYQEPVQGVRRRPDDRHAHLRTRLHRGLDRRLGHAVAAPWPT